MTFLLKAQHIHVIVLMVLRVFSAKQIGMNVGHHHAKMVAPVLMVLPHIIARVQMDLQVNHNNPNQNEFIFFISYKNALRIMKFR